MSIMITKCVVCGKEIIRNGERGKKKKYKRSKNCVTCSHQCSRIYQRVYEYAKYQVKRRMKNE